MFQPPLSVSLPYSKSVLLGVREIHSSTFITFSHSTSETTHSGSYGPNDARNLPFNAASPSTLKRMPEDASE